LPRSNFTPDASREARMANSHIPLLGRSASSQFGVQLFAARTALNYSGVKLLQGLYRLRSDKGLELV